MSGCERVSARRAAESLAGEVTRARAMAAMAAVVEAVGGVLVAVGGAATVQARAEAGAHPALELLGRSGAGRRRSTRTHPRGRRPPPASSGSARRRASPPSQPAPYSDAQRQEEAIPGVAASLVEAAQGGMGGEFFYFLFDEVGASAAQKEADLLLKDLQLGNPPSR